MGRYNALRLTTNYNRPSSRFFVLSKLFLINLSTSGSLVLSTKEKTFSLVKTVGQCEDTPLHGVVCTHNSIFQQLQYFSVSEKI